MVITAAPSRPLSMLSLQVLSPAACARSAIKRAVTAKTSVTAAIQRKEDRNLRRAIVLQSPPDCRIPWLNTERRLRLRILSTRHTQGLAKYVSATPGNATAVTRSSAAPIGYVEAELAGRCSATTSPEERRAGGDRFTRGPERVSGRR